MPIKIIKLFKKIGIQLCKEAIKNSLKKNVVSFIRNNLLLFYRINYIWIIIIKKKHRYTTSTLKYGVRKSTPLQVSK